MVRCNAFLSEGKLLRWVNKERKKRGWRGLGIIHHGCWLLLTFEGVLV